LERAPSWRALNKVHWKNGLYGPGAFEVPLALALAAAAVGLGGSAAISVDRIVGRRSPHPGDGVGRAVLNDASAVPQKPQIASASRASR
jgi:hypothetical protein